VTKIYSTSSVIYITNCSCPVDKYKAVVIAIAHGKRTTTTEVVKTAQ